MEIKKRIEPKIMSFIRREIIAYLSDYRIHKIEMISENQKKKKKMLKNEALHNLHNTYLFSGCNFLSFVESRLYPNTKSFHIGS
jgi:hypothetical protein